jgi:hypothetical protein
VQRHASELPDFIVDELRKLPRYADRMALASAISRLIFPVSRRTLEAWPLRWRRVNGHAVAETYEAFAHAWGQAMCIVDWSSTRTEPSTRRLSTSETHEIIWSTKSRAFALATEEVTARTTFSIPSATASLWLLGTAKAFNVRRQEAGPWKRPDRRRFRGKCCAPSTRSRMAAVTQRHRQGACQSNSGHVLSQATAYGTSARYCGNLSAAGGEGDHRFARRARRAYRTSRLLTRENTRRPSPAPYGRGC